MRVLISKLLSLSLVLAGTVGVKSALASTEVYVDLNPREIFVPVGFDDNDEVVVVTDGYMPDPCHRLRRTEVKVNLEKHEVMVQPRAQVFTGTCTDMTVPYTSSVRVGELPNGKYSIVTRDGKVRGSLDVKKATTTAIDDYAYAPIDAAGILVNAQGKLEAYVKGRFTSTCVRLKEVKLINSGKTLEVLPIMEEMGQGSSCQKIETPFEQHFVLPELPVGRYLLHVRSLNGQSINEVFNSGWSDE